MTDPATQSTVSSILLAVGFVLWRTYSDRKAARERKALEQRVEALEKDNVDIINTLKGSPFVTFPNPYRNGNATKRP